MLELGIGPECFTSPHLFNCKTSFRFQNCLFRYFAFPAKVPFPSALHTGAQIQVLLFGTKSWIFHSCATRIIVSIAEESG